MSSPSAILIDLDTGQVLYAKSADRRRPIASLTKVMTALVTMSKADPSEIAVVDGAAAYQSGSVLGLKVGERISVGQLLWALLLQSSNDAAVALAEHVGGTQAGFVHLMNLRAASMHLLHSHFADTSGLDNSGYSSARDLAAITRAAFGDSFFEQIVRTRFHRIPGPGGTVRHIQNRNILLWLYPGAIGVKTGFTTPAGHCLIAAAERDGTRLLTVALGAGGDDAGLVFNDGASLLNYGYTAFQERQLIHAGDAVGPFVVGGQSVPVVAGGTVQLLVRTDLVGTATIDVFQDTGALLPVVAGEPLGRLVVKLAGKRVGEVPVVAAASVAAPPPAPPPPVPKAPGPLDRMLAVLSAVVRAVLGPFL